jgi:hypothetical protein
MKNVLTVDVAIIFNHKGTKIKGRKRVSGFGFLGAKSSQPQKPGFFLPDFGAKSSQPQKPGFFLEGTVLIIFNHKGTENTKV